MCSGSSSFVGGVLSYDGITLLPGWEDTAGNDILLGHFRQYERDLLLTLHDVHNVFPEILGAVPTACWTPVDSSPMSSRDIETLRNSEAQPIAMSKHGMAELRKQAFRPLYWPHGIDTQIFSPQPRTEARELLRIPDADTFVIGINAFNKDAVRKAFPEQMAAFAKFHERHPNSLLTMHSLTSVASGCDLTRIATELRITDCVTYPDQYAYVTGLIKPEHLAIWYSALDLYSGATYGEGFGLPVIEAQACGTPVVVNNFSAMSELAGPGWRVGGTRFWIPVNNAWWQKPDIDELAAAYEAAWQAREDGELESIGKTSREFAMQYDAQAVQDAYLVPLLEKLEQFVEERRTP